MTALQSESITTLMPALLDAQAEFKPAVKDAENPHFGSSFLSLAGVIGSVSTALRAHRIAVMQLTDVEADGRTVLLTRLVHESGEWIGGRYPINPVKNDPQAYGSALTYARRYGLMSLLGIVAEDDDGNAATQPPATFDTPPPDPCVVLRKVIAELGTERGWTITDTGADFYTWATGVDIREADEALLTKYVDHLRTAVTP